MTKIKDISIIILIVFIIASILYGIHMFRYEYVKDDIRHFKIYRIDRITNDVCLYVYGDQGPNILNYGKKSITKRCKD